MTKAWRLGGAALMMAASAALRAPPAAASMEAPGPTIQVGQSPSGNYLAALIASADRDTNASAIFYREALRDDPRNPDLIERAFAAALSDGDAASAFSLADRLILRDPANSLARLALAVRAIADGQYVAARTQMSFGDAGRAHDVTTGLLTAWSYAGQGDLHHALDTLDHIHDSSVAAFRDFHAGLIADLLGNPIEARRRLKSAYEADKNLLRFGDVYARFLANHGDKDGAISVYEDYAKVLSHHPLVDAALADLKADKPLAPLVGSARDGAAEALFGLGSAGTREGDELPALIYLRMALYLSPGHELAALTIANLFEDLKQYGEAISAYDLVPQGSPMRETADIQTAFALDSEGQHDEAVKRLSALLAGKPDDIQILDALGGLQREAKSYEDAAATYSKAIAAVGAPGRSNWTLFYFRGICYERSKQWPKAEADFKEALTLYPDQPLVLNYLGYSWIDKGINLDEAFKMLRRAVELRPNDGYIVDSLGWAHYKLGQYQEAAEDLEKAIELKPADPVVNDHLGDIFWRINRHIEAGFQWNHARDMGPDPEDLPNILKKIKDGLPDQTAAPAPAETPPAPAAPAPSSGG